METLQRYRRLNLFNGIIRSIKYEMSVYLKTQV